MTPDIINALFELAGGIFIINNCRVLYRDKEVKGVSVLTTAFFFSWGLWNLYFYPALGQYWSFLGGLLIVTGNCAWVAMALYYARRERNKRVLDTRRFFAALATLRSDATY